MVFKLCMTLVRAGLTCASATGARRASPRSSYDRASRRCHCVLQFITAEWTALLTPSWWMFSDGHCSVCDTEVLGASTM
ncbi:uncharacterized protein C8Q71DRAFT_791663 [Rhodofomes roseus]|uniref:Secreted protein n=1 Tax=Rhodofomes roseus TaxID=34475 RepID=A0ABQ8JY67_9APHY|nr:uncharacterized protein C8Q71DRAFT_791663 [Rhodofomes roseus]KAH9829089.1 hypothetical protein C8Q71DRAFT_791663 [Rhodofomes roseus]